MKEHVDKQLENLVAKAIKQSALETPSFDFTANLMLKVESLKQSPTTIYQPPISKHMWFWIFTGFVAFVAYILFITKPEASVWFSSINILDMEKISNIFSGIHLSRTVIYATVFFAVMLLIQIPLLKNYFDKRLVV